MYSFSEKVLPSFESLLSAPATFATPQKSGKRQTPNPPKIEMKKAKTRKMKRKKNTPRNFRECQCSSTNVAKAFFVTATERENKRGPTHTFISMYFPSEERLSSPIKLLEEFYRLVVDHNACRFYYLPAAMGTSPITKLKTSCLDKKNVQLAMRVNSNIMEMTVDSKEQVIFALEAETFVSSHLITKYSLSQRTRHVVKSVKVKIDESFIFADENTRSLYWVAYGAIRMLKYGSDGRSRTRIGLGRAIGRLTIDPSTMTMYGLENRPGIRIGSKSLKQGGVKGHTWTMEGRSTDVSNMIAMNGVVYLTRHNVHGIEALDTTTDNITRLKCPLNTDDVLLCY